MSTETKPEVYPLQDQGGEGMNAELSIEAVRIGRGF